MKLLRDKDLCWSMREFFDVLGVTRLDLASFLLHCPRQRPRDYTIASSPKVSANRISICVSLTSQALPSLRPAIEQLQGIGALPKPDERPNPSDPNDLRVAQSLARAARLEEGADRGRFYGVASQWMC